MLAQLSIRTKITIVITFLLVAMTSMGLLAVTKMGAIYASATEIQANWLPSVRALGDLRAEVNSYRNIIRAHLLSETAEDKAAVEKRLVVGNGRLAKARADYEAMITSAEERSLYNEWRDQWAVYERGAQQVLALSQASVGRMPHEAQEMNEKTMLPLAFKADAMLVKDVEFNKRGADAAAETAAENYRVLREQDGP
jgi:methyl-accepting chemotaxis protein